MSEETLPQTRDDQAIAASELEADAPLVEDEGLRDDVDYENLVIESLPVDDIYEADNMRTGALNISQLMESIRQGGVIHPVAVRKTPNDSKITHDLPYELIAGHRRLASYRALGIRNIPATIHDSSDMEVMIARITENLQRENPNPIDEARAMQQMVQQLGMSQTNVAKKLGVTDSQVSKRLTLLSLPDPVVRLLSDGNLSASHGEALAALPGAKAQLEMADIAVRTGASVSKLESYVRDVRRKEDQHQQDLQEGGDAAAAGGIAPQVLDQSSPLDIASARMMTALPYLKLKHELSEGLRLRRSLYLLIRSCNDVEMLDYLEAHAGVNRRTLWAWIMRQPQAEVERLIDVMQVRWFQAAHRYPTFSPDLVQSLGEPTDTKRDPLWGMPGHENVLESIDDGEP